MSWLRRLKSENATTVIRWKYEQEEHDWNNEDCKRDVTEDVAEHTLCSTDAAEMESVAGPWMAECNAENTQKPTKETEKWEDKSKTR